MVVTVNFLIIILLIIFHKIVSIKLPFDVQDYLALHIELELGAPSCT